MKFYVGSQNEFVKFVNSVKAEDNVVLVSHNDLDGVASAVFITLILESKNIQPKEVSFENYSLDVFERIREIVDESNANKIIFTDMSLESANGEEFKKFKEEFDCFLIDHHPVFRDFDYGKNVIKSEESGDCTALIVYEIGESLFDRCKWEWLRDLAMIADYSWKKKENMELLRQKYSGLTEENILSSRVGLVERMVSQAIVYFKSKGGLVQVYKSLLKGREGLEELEKYSKKVREDIEKYVSEMKTNAEFFPERKLYWYEIDPEFNITSLVATILSNVDKGKTFVVVSPIEGEDCYKVSLRNQNKTEDVNKLLRKAGEGLKDFSGGGHIAAAAGKFFKKDLTRFKKRILKNSFFEK